MLLWATAAAALIGAAVAVFVFWTEIAQTPFVSNIFGQFSEVEEVEISAPFDLVHIVRPFRATMSLTN
jgi:hypothetical protein